MEMKNSKASRSDRTNFSQNDYSHDITNVLLKKSIYLICFLPCTVKPQT